MRNAGRRGWRGRAVVAALAVGWLAPAPAARADEAGAGTVEIVPEPADRAEEPSGISAVQVGATAMDLILLRPLGAAASVAGLAFFAASAPLVAASGGIGTSWDVFVLAPVDYTFQRPLGDF